MTKELNALMASTPTDKQREEFDAWLEVPENRAKWDAALAKAAAALKSQPRPDSCPS